MEGLERRIQFVRTAEENQKNSDPVSEEKFRQLYAYEAPEEKTCCSRLKEKVKCNSNGIFSLFPILKWLPKYSKSYIVNDLIAGLTVGVMHIPQGMAYALLGGVPPVVGIYMAFFPVLIYIFMGTSHHVSMGTFAVVSMLVGQLVDELSETPDVNVTTTINPLQAQYDYVDDYVERDYTPMEVATGVCLFVGIWQIILSIFRMGSLSALFSQNLASGFTTGAAVHVLVSQIKNLLGINVKRYSGPFKIIYTITEICKNLTKVNLVAITMSSSFITLLVIYNEVIKPFIQKKTKRVIPFPMELFVVIAGTVLSIKLKLHETFGVSIVESVPKGLPQPTIPPLDLLDKVALDCLVISIVAISINLSMANIFAQKMGYEIDGNQEILASGIGNIFGSFFSCMPYAASLSRSLVQVSVGGKTLMTSAVSAVSLLFVLLFLGPYFEPLPYCVLSTIIVVALKGMFMQIRDVPSIFKMSRLDGFLWITTFLAVVVLDISYGLAIGLVVSMGCLLVQNRRFEVLTLGCIPGTNTYLDVNSFKKAQLVNNVLILQIVGGIHFVNCNLIKNLVLKLYIKFHNSVPPSLGSEAKQVKCRTLVIDLSCVPVLDPSAVKALKSIYEDLKTYGSELLLCGCHLSIYKNMERANLFDVFPTAHVFHELSAAVEYAKLLESKADDQGEMILKF